MFRLITALVTCLQLVVIQSVLAEELAPKTASSGLFRMSLIPDKSDKAFVHVMLESLKKKDNSAIWVSQENFKKSFEVIYGWDDQNRAWVYSADSGLYYWSENQGKWQQHIYRNTDSEPIPKFILDAEPQLLRWIKDSPK